MDEVDRRIINRIQDLFPIEPRPFRSVAQELGLEEQDVIARIKRLNDKGIIRRIGGNFSPDRLGFFSTLCAARVAEAKIELFTRTVNAYSGVTHNYMRDNTYNVWFTFIAPKWAVIEESLKKISQDTGVTDILNLPATHMFKISAKFKV
jgi:DNA-binding Lrp family transcriptional regulator